MCVYDLPRVSDWASNVTKSESPSKDTTTTTAMQWSEVRRSTRIEENMCVYDLPRGSDWAYNVTKSESPSNDNDNSNSNNKLLLLSLSLLGDSELAML